MSAHDMLVVQLMLGAVFVSLSSILLIILKTISRQSRDINELVYAIQVRFWVDNMQSGVTDIKFPTKKGSQNE